MIAILIMYACVGMAAAMLVWVTSYSAGMRVRARWFALGGALVGALVGAWVAGLW